MSELIGTTKISKKETRKVVFKKLSSALGDYRGQLKDKKVARNLKKFSKVLADNIVRSARKQSGKAKAPKNTLAESEQVERKLQATN